jgi:CDP-paratose 2-epimerase
VRILITGICGFVGSSLAEWLRTNRPDLSIVGIDNLMRPGSEINRARLAGLGVSLSHGDVRCASDWDALPAADWVIEAAANPSVLAGLTAGSTSRQLVEHNLGGALHALEYCKRHKAGFILLSSSRVYSVSALAALPLKLSPDGRAFCLDRAAALPEGVGAEGIGVDFSTQAPVSLYGGTKLAAEIMALEYGEAFGFPVWVNRCGVLAGAGQFGTADQGIVAYWVNQHLRGRKPLRFIGFDGTGKQVRDAMHPFDLARLLDRQMNTTRRGGQQVYTVGGGQAGAISLRQLHDWCDERFAVAVPVSSDPQLRPYDIPWVVMDNTVATRDFDGWKPEIGVQDILMGIAEHAERHPNWLELSGA